MIRVGTAGWSLPTSWREPFPEGDTHLDRYARVLVVVEINRTFRKLPRASTFSRWADSVPEGFRFSVKVPREVTHDRRLDDPGGPLAGHRVARVAADPPRAETDGRAGGFGGLAYFRLHGDLRTYYSPYRPDVEEDYGEEGDPEVGLEGWVERLREAEASADEVSCVFDNTAAGEGTGDALALRRLLERGDGG